MESHPRATLHHGLADVSLGPALEERLARIWF